MFGSRGMQWGHVLFQGRLPLNLRRIVCLSNVKHEDHTQQRDETIYSVTPFSQLCLFLSIDVPSMCFVPVPQLHVAACHCSTGGLAQQALVTLQLLSLPLSPVLLSLLVKDHGTYWRSSKGHFHAKRNRTASIVTNSLLPWCHGAFTPHSFFHTY